MAIVFPYHLLGVAYLSLFAVERWRAPAWLRALWPRRRAVAASGSAAGSGALDRPPGCDHHADAAARQEEEAWCCRIGTAMH